MIRLRVFLVVFGCLGSVCLWAQNAISLPDITNYSRQQYLAGSQNWQMTQHEDGTMFFANNEGLLSFDGVNWHTIALPNRSKLRSVASDEHGRIYAGGEDEFGYFDADVSGRLVYHSFLSRLPKNERNLSDIWNIAIIADKVFFRSAAKILVLTGNRFNIYHPRSHWRFMGQSNQVAYAQDLEQGLLRFVNGNWETFLAPGDLPMDCLITDMVALNKDSTLITTFNHGCYLLWGNRVSPWTSPGLNQAAAGNIYKAVEIRNQRIALATSMGGLFVVDNKGELLQQFGLKEGLQNTNIRSVFLDDRNNLWLGLDDGIDCITINNAIRHISPDRDNPGSGYAAIRFHNNLYLGTSTGLFSIPVDSYSDLSLVKGNFKKVEASSGQVWGLANINNRLFMAHHEGGFLVENEKAVPLFSERTEGFWNFWPMQSVFPSATIAGGNYAGIFRLTFAGNRFEPAGRLTGFAESSRFIVVEHPGTLFTSHPLKGVFRLASNDKNETAIKKFGREDGVNSELNNAIFRIKGRITLATEEGLLEYDSATGKFLPSTLLQPYFKCKQVSYLREDAEGNIWFTEGKEVGVLDMQGDQPALIYFPELRNKFVRGFEHIYPVDRKNILIGGDKGFFLIDYQSYKAGRYPLRVRISSVTCSNGTRDSIYYGGYTGGESTIRTQTITYDFNSLRINYAGLLYGQPNNVEYSFMLEGFDQGWSPWTNIHTKEFTNLPEGTYTFHVKARNNLGRESAVSCLSFTISPPWYRHWIAKTIYVLLAGLLFYFIYRHLVNKFIEQQQKYEQEQKQMLYLHQLELDKNEKEIIKLRNEKLEDDIKHKNSELASTAMHLVQKSEMLNSIKTELTKLLKKLDADKDQEETKRIFRLLTDEAKVDKDWDQFSSHFDNVHSDFLKLVKEKHPQLSATDLKLCAYLRMNLTTKEIAQLMNISVRGVEIARYRLRKKLDLATEVNLVSYFVNFDPSIN